MGTAHVIASNPEPWDSVAIPPWTRANEGTKTPGGQPAVFRSHTHAWIALRLVFLADVAGQSPAEVAGRAELYRQRFERYRQHLDDMRSIVALMDDDLSAAAQRWNSIDQPAANAAFTTVICEQEWSPKINLATMALKHFGLGPAASVPTEKRDRRIAARDHRAAWQASPGGICRSCGNPTISQNQHDRLRKIMRSHPDLFDLTPSYVQSSGKLAPLWSSRLLIAAKGVADHIHPWSCGGRTAPENLANVCAGCNYSRNDAPIEPVRIAAYS